MAIRDCSHLTSRTYVSQHLRLHLVDWGNPDAPPPPLLHGGRDHCRNWDWVALELRSDFHIIAPHLMGHGVSHSSPAGSSTAALHASHLTLILSHPPLSPSTHHAPLSPA